MRIVLCSPHYFPTRPEGSSRLAFDEALSLRNAGHEVWLIAQRSQASSPIYEFENGLHVLQYPAARLGSFNPAKIFFHQQRTSELITKFVPSPVHIIHGHSLLSYAGALRLSITPELGTCYSIHSTMRDEMIASARGATIPSWLRYWLTAELCNVIERRCVLESARVTAFSEFTRELVRKNHGHIASRRTRVLRGWVNTQRFCVSKNPRSLREMLGWPVDTRVLFTVRRLVPRMGLDRLLRALVYSKRAGLKFVLFIAGTGPLSSVLGESVVTLGLQDNVFFLGRVPDELLPKMYAAADAFILPTAQLECFSRRQACSTRAGCMRL